MLRTGLFYGIDEENGIDEGDMVNREFKEIRKIKEGATLDRVDRGASLDRVDRVDEARIS